MRNSNDRQDGGGGHRRDTETIQFPLRNQRQDMWSKFDYLMPNVTGQDLNVSVGLLNWIQIFLLK